MTREYERRTWPYMRVGIVGFWWDHGHEWDAGTDLYRYAELTRRDSSHLKDTSSTSQDWVRVCWTTLCKRLLVLGPPSFLVANTPGRGAPSLPTGRRVSSHIAQVRAAESPCTDPLQCELFVSTPYPWWSRPPAAGSPFGTLPPELVSEL